MGDDRELIALCRSRHDLADSDDALDADGDTLRRIANLVPSTLAGAVASAALLSELIGPGEADNLPGTLAASLHQGLVDLDGQED